MPEGKANASGRTDEHYAYMRPYLVSWLGNFFSFPPPFLFHIYFSLPTEARVWQTVFFSWKDYSSVVVGY